MITATTMNGVYDADPIHSSFAFAVKHLGVGLFRGTLSDVDAQLQVTDGEAQLDGVARVESISITNPPEFRAHVLGEEFFDAERHPEVRFKSTRVSIGDGGELSVEGDLTIKGVSHEVTATGTLQEPREDPYGGMRGNVELEAEIDRRDWNMSWNAPLPGGGDALGTKVTLTVTLEMVARG